jgi:hypothetical protein
LSGYSKIDFSISEDAMVIEAVQKFAAFNIGCLVTTNTKGMCLQRLDLDSRPKNITCH